MKALVIDAEWKLRKGYELTPFEKRTGRAVHTNNIYKNPVMEIKEIKEPSIKPDEVLLEVKACGICGSDVHLLPEEVDEEGYTIYAGMTKFPVVLGHEFSGEVVEVGKEVKELSVGDRVTSEEMVWCGKCNSCRNGFPNHCLDIDEIGFTLDGAYAKYVAVPAKHCWKLDEIFERYPDEKIAYEVGATVEPTSVAYNGIFIRAEGFLPGSTVAVYGTGPIGLACISLAKAAGAAKTVAFEVSEERRKLAKEIGADYVHNPKEVVPSKVVLEVTKGGGADFNIEAAGVPNQTIPEMERSLAVNGKILQIGRAPNRVPLDLEVLMVSRVRLYGTLGHSGHKIFPSVIKMMGAGLLDNSKMITNRFPLEKAIEAIRKSSKKKDGKIIVKP